MRHPLARPLLGILFAALVASMPAGAVLAASRDAGTPIAARSMQDKDGSDDGGDDDQGRGKGGDDKGGGSGSSGSGSSGRGGRGEDPVPVTGEIPAGSQVIRILDDDGFTPASVEIDLGGSVTVVNQHHDDHTATGAGFDTGVIGPGETVTLTFDEAGRFAFACRFHEEMVGSIAVRGEDGVVPEPTPVPTPGSGAQVPVAIVDFAFEAPAITVAAGDTVTWTDTGQAPHTVTAADGTFGSEVLQPGDSFSFTFPEAGTFAYACQLHPDMQGTVTVEAMAASASPATPGSSPGPAAPSPSPEPPSPPPASPAASPSASPGPTVAISIIDLDFDPPSIEVAAGTTVTWTNTGQAPHSATADDASFDSGILDPGATSSVTFTVPGTVAYHCLVHPQMTAVVIVT